METSTREETSASRQVNGHEDTVTTPGEQLCWGKTSRWTNLLDLSWGPLQFSGGECKGHPLGLEQGGPEALTQGRHLKETLG